jgi:hypothetical protein
MWLGVIRRKEEAVTRHFRLSCVSRVFGPTRTCRRVGIRKICVCRREENLRSEVHSVYREALRSLLELGKRYFAEGKSCDEVLEVLMPA